MGSLHRRAARVVLAIAVLLAVLGPLALWLRDSSLVRVEQVTVTGLDGRKSATIRRALVDAATDMTTLHVREDALRSAVSSYPIVRSLRTETDFPHGLRVIVNAYDPVAALRSAGGTLTAVAADGTLLRGNSTRGLPVVGIRSTPPGDRLGTGIGLRGRAAARRSAARAALARRARVQRSARPGRDDGQRSQALLRRQRRAGGEMGRGSRGSRELDIARRRLPRPANPRPSRRRRSAAATGQTLRLHFRLIATKTRFSCSGRESVVLQLFLRG